MTKRIAMILLALSLLVTGGAALAQDTSAEAVVELVATSESFSALVAEYPNYEYYVEQEDDYWYVELYAFDGEDEIWFGEAYINVETLEIQHVFVPSLFDIENLSPEAQAAIVIVESDENFAPLLADFPNYEVFAYEEEGYVFVEFLGIGDEGDEVYLGEAFINSTNMQIEEYFVAQFLTPDEIAEQTPQILELVEKDPAVMNLLATLPPTRPFVEYEPVGAAWLVYYEDGLDIYEVRIVESEEPDMAGLVVESVENVSDFDEAERAMIDRDRAVTIAFEAGPFTHMDLPDDWMTRATPLGDDLYGVDFVTEDGQLILQVIVNMNSGTITEVVEPAG